MTAATHSTPSLSIPPSQNTAPVLEFRCLYSHDIRRKSKRWQDGFLRYHTFNKRVMVYDVPRNFIGDTHWKETMELQEGDELILEKGVLVEVAEAVGNMETDLTPLFERKSKVSPNSKAAEVRPKQPPMIRNTAIYNPPQLRHKSLNTILGTLKGPHGKAVMPAKSPYESRKDAENEWRGERTPKRQKMVDSQPMRNLTKPFEICRPSSKSTPLWARTVDARKARMSRQGSKAENNGPRTGTSPDVVEIDSDTDNVFLDVTLRSTLPEFQKTASLRHTFQPRQASRSAPRLSPPVTISNKVSNVGYGKMMVDKPTENHPREHTVSPPPNPRAKALRLSNGRSRSTLLCQSAPQQRSKLTDQTRTALGQEVRRGFQDPSLFEAIDWDFAPLQELNDHNITNGRAPTSKTHGESPKINQFGSHLPIKPWENWLTPKKSNGMANATEALQKQKHPSSLKDPISDVSDSPNSSSDTFEEMAIIHGRMNQCLLTSTSKASKPKATSTPKPSRPTSRLKLALTRNTKANNPSANPGPGPERGKVPEPEFDTSPRSFRRVTSANDVPISSTAEDWEARNASKLKSKLLHSKSTNVTKALPKKDQPPLLAPPPPVDTDVGPWSTEAFDLFDWRPPGRDKEGKLVDEGNEKAIENGLLMHERSALE